MTETELRIAAVLSGLIILAGLAIAGWAVRTNAQRSFLAQGVFFVMLGLALLVMLVLPGGILRTSLTGAFLLGRRCLPACVAVSLIGTSLPVGASQADLELPVRILEGWVVTQYWLDPVAAAEVILMDGEMVPVERARSDEEGRFRLPLPPPGTYHLQARLEGVSSAMAGPVSVVAGADPPAPMVLEMPSPLVAYAVGCVEEEGTDTPSVLVGVAYEAKAEVLLPGARILARWTEHEAGPVMVAETSADGQGRYRLCTIPAGVEVSVWAGLVGRMSEPVEGIRVAAGSIGRADIALDLETARPEVGRVDAVRGAEEDPSTLAGTLLDATTGQAVGFAVVRLAATSGELETDRAGSFRFDRVDPGRHVLEVRHLAYGVQSVELDVAGGTDVRLDLRLAPRALALEGIDVTARARLDPDRRANPLAARVAAGEELLRAQERGATVDQVARLFPNIRVELVDRPGPGAEGPEVWIWSPGRGMPCMEPSPRCPRPMVAVFVDGVRIAAPQYFLYNLQVTEFESIEYVSPLSGAIRYGLDAGHHGVLLLWTRGRGPHVHPDRDEQRR